MTHRALSRYRARVMVPLVRRSLSVIAAVILTVVTVSACDDDDGPADSGYGAGQSVPAAMDCEHLCARMGDCFAALCNEDTMSTRYDGVGDLLRTQCEIGCADATVRSNISPDTWRCTFQSSCRAVFGQNKCGAMAKYSCS